MNLTLIEAYNALRSALIREINDDTEFQELLAMIPTNTGYNYQIKHPTISQYQYFTDIIDAYKNYLIKVKGKLV